MRKISSTFDHFNLTFDQLLSIFNPNLGVDLRGQLLLKYKVKFNNFVSMESSDRKLSIHM